MAKSIAEITESVVNTLSPAMEQAAMLAKLQADALASISPFQEMVWSIWEQTHNSKRGWIAIERHMNWLPQSYQNEAGI